MLRSLLRGVGMGAGLGIGQEIVGAVMQTVRGMTDSANPGNVGGGFFDATAPAIPEQDKQCSGCGEFNTADSRFCGACGNCLMSRINLASGTRCTCGFINARGQRFCSECGTRLEI